MRSTMDSTSILNAIVVSLLLTSGCSSPRKVIDQNTDNSREIRRQRKKLAAIAPLLLEDSRLVKAKLLKHLKPTLTLGNLVLYRIPKSMGEKLKGVIELERCFGPTNLAVWYDGDVELLIFLDNPSKDAQTTQRAGLNAFGIIVNENKGRRHIATQMIGNHVSLILPIE